MTPRKPPNLVLILIDDLGHADLGCTGSTFYETPRLDALARSGARCTHAYAASPVCSPTRASLMSGKHPARLGLTHYIGAGVERGRVVGASYVDRLVTSECSLATALREGGYATWHVGKWHLGPPECWPEHHGFDVNVAGCSWGHPAHGHFSPWKIPNFPDTTSGEYLADRLTDEAIALVESQARTKPGQPFFLNLWHYAVHTPVQAPAHLVARFQEKARRLGLDGVPALVEGEVMESEHCRGRRVVRRVVQSNPTYAAMIANLDANVGRLLDTLDRLGLADDTLVLFTSDNGGLATAEGSPTCNAPLREGKGWLEDGGLRVPLIARWPGRIRAAAAIDTPIITPDLYPTFLEAAGLPPRPQQHRDGRSVLSLLSGTGSPDRDAIYWHFPHYANQGGHPCAAVRVGPHKLIRHFHDRTETLYDLLEDPAETRDLAASMPSLREQLSSRLTRWLEDVSARLPAST
jgi:arylsulfatase A-like enzyme